MGSYINILSAKLGVPKNRIKANNLKYYYTKYPQLCCHYEMGPLTDNSGSTIGPFEFNKAMNVLADYYKDAKTNYYKSLVTEANKYKDGESVLGIETTEELDHMISEYVRFRPNTYVILLWPNAKGKLNDLLKILHDNGHVYYIKKFNLHYKAAKNLIYQLYSDTYRLSKESDINDKLDYIGWKNDTVCSFKVILFDHQSSLPISGSMSPLKQKIRGVWLDGDSSKRGDDFVHINDNFYQTYEYTKLLFNKNSIKALHFQDLNNYLSRKLEKCRIFMNTVKNWIVRNVEPIDYDRFIFMGSTVLYNYGIRVCRDVDGLLSPHPNKAKTHLLEEKIRKSFYNRDTKFFFADIGMQNTTMWKESWDIKDKPWFDLIGIQERDQLIFDPKQYFFFNGLKYVSLINNVRRRILRRKITDYADIMEVERKTYIEIDYPPVVGIKKEIFINDIKKYIKERYPDNDTYKDKLKLLTFEQTA